MVQSEGVAVCDEKSVSFAVEFDFDRAATVVDDVVDVGVGSGAFGEDPSIVDFSFSSAVSSISLALYN